MILDLGFCQSESGFGPGGYLCHMANPIPIQYLPNIYRMGT